MVHGPNSRPILEVTPFHEADSIRRTLPSPNGAIRCQPGQAPRDRQSPNKKALKGRPTVE